jgi:ABC-type phosphate/phosphonate transport system substrate-binding protein
VIASLPMYDYPEVREATDSWWDGIARHFGVPITLDRSEDHKAAWRAPDLLFSQTCGYPLTHEFRGQLQLVATPHYAVDGCDGPNYCSIVFARKKRPLEAFRGAVAAVNNPDSMSGMLAMKLVFAPLARQGRFFREVVKTGGHTNSMRAVRDGKADVCAIDAVCVAFSRRHRPDDLAGLVEIARSPSVPVLPYVTSPSRSGEEIERLREALAQVFDDDRLAEARRILFLDGFSVLDEESYEAIAELERAIGKAGEFELL